MSYTLAELEHICALTQQEIQRLKDVCIVTSQNTSDVEKRLQEEEEKFSESTNIQEFATTAAEETMRELSELEDMLTETQNAYSAAVDTGSFELDESFGLHYKEIEVLMEECNWDVSAFQALLKDRSAFIARIERLRNDRTGKERAKQFNVVFGKYETLNKENQTLHAQHLRLKNELISAERDLEKACGFRRFDRSKAFAVEK